MDALLGRFLVPLDGSRLAESVLPMVVVTASKLKATVLLLHVLERDAPQTVHGERHLTDTPEAEAYLRGVADGLRLQGLEAEVHVHPNPQKDVVESISEHAQEFQADLVVLATHGWGGMRDLLVGSIAQQVLRRGEQPVLLVRPGGEGKPPSFVGRRVLVPLDGSSLHDDPVMPFAARLASGLGAEVFLVMVVPTLSTLRAERSASATLLPGASAEALELKEEDATSYLEDNARLLRELGIPVEFSVLRGNPAASVIAAAQEGNVDLLIMSTHARVGWAAFWAGSIGSKILSRVGKPLLLIRTPA